MTDAGGGGLIAALTPDGRPVSINEKLADSYVARGFTITDEAAAKRIARQAATVKPGRIELAPGQVRATGPDGRAVTINRKLMREYAGRGFTFEGSVDQAPAEGLREPEAERVVIDMNTNKPTFIPGEVRLTSPDGRAVNVSAKAVAVYLDRGFTMAEQPARPAMADDGVLPEAMGDKAPPSAGGTKAGTSY